MDDFEKGKRLIVEGFEQFCKLYEPYFKIMEGAKLLGIANLFEETKDGKDWTISPEHASLVKIGIDTFISSLRNAASVAELERALEDNKRFFEMVFPKGGR